MSCVFCDIVAGRKAAEVVLRTETVLAFLDHRPLFPGHVLVVPHEHHETLADLPVEAVPDVFGTVRRLSRAVEVGLAAHGSFVAINNKISQSVPHLHVHVVPRQRKDGLKGFFWPRIPYESDSAMQAVAERLRQALQQGDEHAT